MRKNPKPGIDLRMSTLVGWLKEHGLIKETRKKSATKIKK